MLASSAHGIERVRTLVRPRLRLAAIALVALAVAVAALGVRWSHISAAPLDFATARQYHSFNIAREYYVRGLSAAPEWKRRVAHANYEQEPSLELPILQRTVAVAYRVAGGERLWIPRLLSALFWLAGGVFLYLLAVRFTGSLAAALAVAIYLFLPFPLVASTSFQPDPAMIMLLLAAALAIVRHHERPTTERLVVAGVVSALAVLVKPGIAAFFLLPLFLALAFVRDGLREALTRRASYAFTSLSLLPTAAAYVYSVITGRFLGRQPGVEINPRLWGEGFYWRGWGDMIEIVLRPPFFGDRAALLLLAVALCAVVVARTSTPRAILVALWVGYLLLGLVVTNQTSSHDYYSLPLVPLVALSVALVASVLVHRLRPTLGRRSVQVGVAAAVVLVAAVGLKQKGGDLRLPRPDAASQRRIEVYEQIGQLVHHTISALVLDPGGLWYHGWVAGRYWPDQGDLLWERRNDRLRPIGADERFVTRDTRYWPAAGTMRPRPSVFIVGEPIQLVFQPDLCVFLSDYPTLAETPDYLIFDLTRKSGSRRLTADERARASIPSGVRFFYRFPPSWRGLRRGTSSERVLRVLGRPNRIEKIANLRKPVEDWFYGPNGKYAAIFVDGRLLARAQSYR